MLNTYYKGSIEGYKDFIGVSEAIPFKFLCRLIKKRLLEEYGEPIMTDKEVYYSGDNTLGVACFIMTYDDGRILIMSVEL